ncbi:MAG: hypothetical protein COY81_05265 [Candidatus Pacebacteria bacterium CG_4_10_14_0_8_um_filter_43_12]|nr:MAG: hypothetical protein COY81_05265 [Candidatus Pacebacteria bacterium CG_4_10_14_0_8_um_filter_43_12]
MKVYFTASLRGKKNNDLDYTKIYSAIENLGHQNIDDLVISGNTQQFYTGSHNDQLSLYKKALDNVKTADLIILEVSIPSLSMGFLLLKALEASKPVIALYKVGYSPFFALGIDDERLQVVDYTEESIEEELKSAIEVAQEKADVRFNFFISPAIGRYLDWVSRVKKIPRSVYLRALIEKEIENNEEYRKLF